MGNIIFGIDIAGIVAQTIAPGLLDVKITNYARGQRDPANISAGITSTPSDHICKGFWKDFLPKDIDGDLILVDDRIAVLIGDTIPRGAIPTKGSAIKIEGQRLFVERILKRDPAAAVYTFQCRDRAGADGI